MKKYILILTSVFISLFADAAIISKENIGIKTNEETKQTAMLCPPPVQPDTIYGNVHPCYNTSATYYVTPVTDATSYTWTLPNGWTGTSTTDSITATVLSNGTITVTANDSCGSSMAAVLNVTYDTVPGMAMPIYGVADTCYGLPRLYYVNPVPGATYYNWIVDFNWSGSSTTDSIVIYNSTHFGSAILITANNNCGHSDTVIKYLFVHNHPFQPYFTVPNNYICSGDTMTIQIASGDYNADSFLWTVPNDATLISGQGTYAITVVFGSLSVDISAVSVSNMCGYSSPGYCLINVVNPPSVPPVITLQGDTLVTVSGSYWYDWYLDGNYINGFHRSYYIPIANGSYTVAISDSTGTYNGARCPTFSTPFIFNSLGVNEITKTNATIDVFPNPATNTLTIHLSSSPSKDESLIITNILGEETYHQPISNPKSTIDISNWSNGVYIYQLTDSNETVRGKFVKE